MVFVTEQTRNLFQTKQGDHSKSKNARVVILVRNTSSGPILHFYQVSSKYSKGSLTYRADTILSNITKGDNAKSKKARVVILVRNTSSGPILHFYQVSKKYSKGSLTYRADTILSNITKGDNAKSKKDRIAILVRDILVLFYISAKYHQNIPKGIRVTKRTRNLFQIKQRVLTPKVTVKYNKGR